MTSCASSQPGTNSKAEELKDVEGTPWVTPMGSPMLATQLRPHIAAVDIYDGGLDKLLAAYYQLKPAVNGRLVMIGCKMCLQDVVLPSCLRY